MLHALELLALSILCGVGAYYHVTWPDWLRESESRWWDSPVIANMMRRVYVVGWVSGCVAFAWLAIVIGGQG